MARLGINNGTTRFYCPIRVVGFYSPTIVIDECIKIPVTVYFRYEIKEPEDVWYVPRESIIPLHVDMDRNVLEGYLVLSTDEEVRQAIISEIITKLKKEKHLKVC